MAAIDKTYVKSWSQIKETIDWAKTVGTVIDDYGNKINPMWWLDGWTEERFNEWMSESSWGEVPMWNTPEYFDIWLIRNCPIEFIQNRLKEQYASDYDDIKNHKIEADTYVRNVGKHFTIEVKECNTHFKDDDLTWFIDVDDMWYDEKTNTWRHMYLEPGPWTSSSLFMKGNINKRKLQRLIKRWKLPVGSVMYLRCDYHRYFMKYLVVTIKK